MYDSDVNFKTNFYLN